MMHKFLFSIGGPPSIAFKFFGFWAKLTFSLMVKLKCRNLIEEGEEITFSNFMSCIYRNSCVSEKAIFNFFDSNLRAFNPLINFIKKFQKMNILFLYGDNDWTQISHAEMMKELIPSIKIEIVPKSGHLLYADNHEFVGQKIIEFEYNSNYY